MSWEIGFDERWNRDIGYGVPAVCDHPDCNEEIDRGLSYVCAGQEPYGGDGCGLYFCEKHRGHNLSITDDEFVDCCERCASGSDPFDPKPDHPTWIRWKLTDESWKEWRDANPEEVARLKSIMDGHGVADPVPA